MRKKSEGRVRRVRAYPRVGTVSGENAQAREDIRGRSGCGVDVELGPADDHHNSLSRTVNATKIFIKLQNFSCIRLRFIMEAGTVY